jgi:hypothetical protein
LLHAWRTRGALPPRPPFCAGAIRAPCLCGACERGGGGSMEAGWGAKGAPRPPSPVAAWPPVRALTPWFAQRGGTPPSLHAWRTRGALPSPSPLSACAIRAPCLCGACEKGGGVWLKGGGAWRERYAPSPVAARPPSARPLPPVRHTCKEGAPLFARAAKWGAVPSPSFRACASSAGHAKGEGGLKRGTWGGAPRVRPLPIAARPPNARPHPRFATRAERERPRFAHVAKWGASPPCRTHPASTGHAKGRGGIQVRNAGQCKRHAPPFPSPPRRCAAPQKRGGGA